MIASLGRLQRRGRLAVIAAVLCLSAPSLASAQLAAPSSRGSGVEVDQLAAVDADSGGILGEADGGLGAQMWDGSSRAVVEALLPRLPVATDSPAMRDLMRRLLLSPARPPQGKASEGSLVTLRARLLLQMGDLAGARALIAAMPARVSGPDLARVQADAGFLANDDAGACAIAEREVKEQPDIYWQKAAAFCQALAGEREKAALGVALLREIGERDPAFFAAISAMTGEPRDAHSPPLGDATPLDLAMARAAKLPLSPNVAQSNNLGVLRAVATSPNVPIDVRLQAAERAEAAGTLPDDVLHQLLLAASESTEAAAGSSPSKPTSDARTSATLYRTALAQPTADAEAEVVARALAFGRRKGRYVATVRTFLPALKHIPVAPDLTWFAPEAIRAFLVVGDRQAASSWLSLLSENPASDPDAEAQLTALTPVLRLAELARVNGADSADLIRWWKSVEGTDRDRDRAALIYTLLEAVGVAVPPALWDALAEGPDRQTATVPDAVLWHMLVRAAKAKRAAETVLTSLLALSPDGPAATATITLGLVVGSIHTIGLKNEARALSIEAAVVNS